MPEPSEYERKIRLNNNKNIFAESELKHYKPRQKLIPTWHCSQCANCILITKIVLAVFFWKEIHYH